MRTRRRHTTCCSEVYAARRALRKGGFMPHTSSILAAGRGRFFCLGKYPPNWRGKSTDVYRLEEKSLESIFRKRGGLRWARCTRPRTFSCCACWIKRTERTSRVAAAGWCAAARKEGNRRILMAAYLCFQLSVQGHNLRICGLIPGTMVVDRAHGPAWPRAFHPAGSFSALSIESTAAYARNRHPPAIQLARG